MLKHNEGLIHAIKFFMGPWLILCLAVWGGGCASTSVVPSKAASKDSEIKTILVSSFQVIKPRGKVETAACPVTGIVCQPGLIEPGAVEFLSENLLAIMEKKSGFIIIPPSRAEGARYEILSEDLGISQRRLLVETGRKLKADAVLAGTLYRFRPRVGNAFSVEDAASVGFGVHLLRIRDGRLLWTRQFDETQKSLSEDLFQFGNFMKRGGGWLSARELAVFGLQEVMEGFPLP